MHGNPAIDKPEVLAYDSWLLDTDQYFLQPELPVFNFAKFF